MMKYILTVILLIMPAISIYAQIPDSAYVDKQMAFSLDKSYKRSTIFNASYAKFIVPAACISYGIITRVSKPLRELDHSIHNEVNKHLQTKIPVDDYSQYAPALAVYGLSFMGVKAKHNFRDRTIVMATSYIAAGAVVRTMKSSIHVMRPDGSNSKSFPSGHTATAFVGAHILFKEYKDTSPWIGIAGYTVAAGTGALRIVNRKHWLSDVVTGAGIGIASAEVGYLMLPVFHKIFGIKDKTSHLVILPSVGVDSYGIGLAYTFRR
ncbi:MAG: phosphatase PAP2 family protein [Tannerellaceae bacterium]|jgi:membrane-associated phospholipid phosphatase|nr:phosphatase PAP2 family protein [Tannerellaceae bacterium]